MIGSFEPPSYVYIKSICRDKRVTICRTILLSDISSWTPRNQGWLSLWKDVFIYRHCNLLHRTVSAPSAEEAFQQGKCALTCLHPSHLHHQMVKLLFSFSSARLQLLLFILIQFGFKICTIAHCRILLMIVQRPSNRRWDAYTPSASKEERCILEGFPNAAV